MKKDGCIFCMLANGDIPANSPYEDDLVKVIFDRGPATKGHALILPKNHCEDIYEIFSRLSSTVHSNTHFKQYNMERMDFNTFDIARNIVTTLYLITDKLCDRIFKDEDFKTFLKDLKAAEEYHSKYNESLVQLLHENKLFKRL